MTESAAIWTYLPDRVDPIRAGTVRLRDDGCAPFRYDGDFLAHALESCRNFAFLAPDLPFEDVEAVPAPGLTMAGSLRDASPDAWGRRVIRQRRGVENDLSEIDYLLSAGGDRIGAMAFTITDGTFSCTAPGEVSLEDLVAAVRSIEEGKTGPSALDNRIGVGGARPKALVDLCGRKWIAKFPLQGDHQNVVKAEYVAMRLAAECGLDVAPVKIEKAAGANILLIERFDRVKVGDMWRKRGVVSALTMLGLDEMMARYASYGDLCAVMTNHLVDPAMAMLELFQRLTFNVLCGNTDDHARNHAFIWDGGSLSLSPAYDICPQTRAGGEASQAMLIAGNDRSSRLSTCLEAAAAFRVSKEDAADIVRRQIRKIAENWAVIVDEAELSSLDKEHLASRSVLNGFCIEGSCDRELDLAFRDASSRLT